MQREGVGPIITTAVLLTLHHLRFDREPIPSTCSVLVALCASYRLSTCVSAVQPS